MRLFPSRAALAAALAIAFAAPAAGAQQSDTARKNDRTVPRRSFVATKAATGARASVDTVLRTLPRATRGAELPAPPSKGGTRASFRTAAGQGYCRVRVDNRTPWYIAVAVDDNTGVVVPYGDLYGWVVCGATRFMAAAEFDDGSVQTWGPEYYRVGADGFTWQLTR